MSTFHTNGHNIILFLLFILKIVHFSTQVGESTESINETIDKLMKLTDSQNGTDKKSVSFIKSAGNDSDIIYIRNPKKENTKQNTTVPKIEIKTGSRRKMEPHVEVSAEVDPGITVNEFEVNLANNADASTELQNMIDNYMFRNGNNGNNEMEIEVTPIEDDTYPFKIENEPVNNYRNQYPNIVTQVTQEMKSETKVDHSKHYAKPMREENNNDQVMSELKRLYAELQLMKAFQEANTKQAVNNVRPPPPKNQVKENYQQNDKFNENLLYDSQSNKRHSLRSSPPPTDLYQNPYPIMNTVINSQSIPLQLRQGAERIAFGVHHLALSRVQLRKHINYLTNLIDLMLLRCQ